MKDQSTRPTYIYTDSKDAAVTEASTSELLGELSTNSCSITAASKGYMAAMCYTHINGLINNAISISKQCPILPDLSWTVPDIVMPADLNKRPVARWPLPSKLIFIDEDTGNTTK